MVYLSSGVWVDIYLNSSDGGSGLVSQYGIAPLTGTEGLTWYSFVERALASGKRLLTYSEWIQAAYGSPQGLGDSNTNAWSAYTNSGRAPCGSVDNAVSAVGCRDCVGNTREWTSEIVSRGERTVLTGSGIYPSYDGGRASDSYTDGNGHSTDGAWGWDTTSPFGDGFGNIYQYYDYSVSAMVASGYWKDGPCAGTHSVALHYVPWYISAAIGGRCACDSF
jgi:formylglycine-generating enzyme required for sulfatase activity